MSQLFSFQGRILLGERLANGKPGKLEWVGNASACTLSIKTESTEKTESFSGQRMPYGRLQTGKSVTVKLDLDEILPVNLINGLYSTQIDIPSAKVTDEKLPIDLVAGDIVRLDNSFIDPETLQIRDENNFILGKDRVIIDSTAAGLLKIVDIHDYRQPLRANYEFTNRSVFTIFSQTPPERYFVLDGINTDNNQPVMLSLYRLHFDPTESLEIINDKYGTLSLNGSALLDTVNVSDPALGGFGKLELKVS